MLSLASAKAAAGNAAATMASGIAYAIDLIPDDIGKAVSLIGGVLSLVMIQYWRNNNQKVSLEKQKLIIENKILDLQLDAAQIEAEKKRRATDGKL